MHNSVMKNEFDEQLSALVKTKNCNSVYMNEEQYKRILREVCEAKSKTNYKTDRDYRRLYRYDVMLVGEEKRLISPLNEKNKNIKYFVTVENLFDVAHNAHLKTGHGGRNKMMKEINETYKNVTIDSVMLYLSLCEACQKKTKNKKKALVAKPNLASELDSRCQVDLIDLQNRPDGEYKFMLRYQDHLTKFILLKPLKTKTAVEVANILMEIFTTFGAPSILQSDDGREFANQVITELTNLWDGIKIICGTPRHSQSQGSIEDTKNMIVAWMESNKSTKWSEGLKYVQLMKNRSFHEEIKQTPYEALFGSKMKLGLKSSSVPCEMIDAIQSEEELANMINEEGAVTVLEGSKQIKIEFDTDQTAYDEMGFIKTEGNAQDAELQTENLNEDFAVKQENVVNSEISPVPEQKVLIQQKRQIAEDDLHAKAKKNRQPSP